jgi:hypothetical protein
MDRYQENLEQLKQDRENNKNEMRLENGKLLSSKQKVLFEKALCEADKGLKDHAKAKAVQEEGLSIKMRLQEADSELKLIERGELEARQARAETIAEVWRMENALIESQKNDVLRRELETEEALEDEAESVSFKRGVAEESLAAWVALRTATRGSR